MGYARPIYDRPGPMCPILNTFLSNLSYNSTLYHLDLSIYLNDRLNDQNTIYIDTFP